MKITKPGTGPKIVETWANTPQKSFFYRASISDALNILGAGKFARNWTRTIWFHKAPFGDIADRDPTQISLQFKEYSPFKKSAIFGYHHFEGKTWEYGENLVALNFRTSEICAKFLKTAEITGVNIPKNVSIYIYGWQKLMADPEAIIGRPFTDVEIAEIVEYAIRRYVNSNSVPQEFWSHKDTILDILASLYFKKIVADDAFKELKKLDSGLSGKDLLARLPDELINEFVVETMQLEPFYSGQNGSF
jgi:hypothetical protein